ncbi:Dipeptide transport system permease protein DppB [Thermoflexales bacterium]|nr:Dipeptide transport system permease protein DppB [Thermoflexales bacterium]
MPPLLKYIARRLLLVPITLIIITLTLYGFAMLVPAEQRAQLYWPSNLSPDQMTAEQEQKIVERIVHQRGLNDPFPVQYLNWLGNMLRGEWGWSPNLRVPVLDYLQRRIPVTLELTLFAMLLFIPLGIVSGVIASLRHRGRVDHGFRATAFVATSIPPFILGLMMISVFYVGLRWFAPGRLSSDIEILVKSPAFHAYTGLVTIDGLLNGRLDVTKDALLHLAMPVIVVAALPWATVARVTRAGMIEESGKEYAIAAQARGVSQRSIVWRHTLRNTLSPVLTASALSTATLVTGIYVVEIIFNLKGVSEMLTGAARFTALDVAAALGFAVYSALLVLVIMLLLDILQAVFDPRLRERIDA